MRAAQKQLLVEIGGRPFARQMGSRHNLLACALWVTVILRGQRKFPLSKHAARREHSGRQFIRFCLPDDWLIAEMIVDRQQRGQQGMAQLLGRGAHVRFA